MTPVVNRSLFRTKIRSFLRVNIPNRRALPVPVRVYESLRRSSRPNAIIPFYGRNASAISRVAFHRVYGTMKILFVSYRCTKIWQRLSRIRIKTRNIETLEHRSRAKETEELPRAAKNTLVWCLPSLLNSWDSVYFSNYTYVYRCTWYTNTITTLTFFTPLSSLSLSTRQTPNL